MLKVCVYNIRGGDTEAVVRYGESTVHLNDLEPAEGALIRLLCDRGTRTGDGPVMMEINGSASSVESIEEYVLEV